MRRLVLVLILFTLVLFSSHPTITQAQEDQPRLVVFEAFTRSDSDTNAAAGEAIDRLADEYAKRSVVFLEQDRYSHIGDRFDRWLAAYDNTGQVIPPLVMVDSGHEIREGVVSFYNTYKSIVDKERKRVAEAEIQAISYRIGNTLHFDIELTNLCGSALSSSNAATVHAIVYEKARDPNRHTGRIVRAATSTGISPLLAHGATRDFTLQVTVSDVDWTKIHSLILVDYRSGGTGAYDMLQAAPAPLTTFTVQPKALTFMVDPADMLDGKIVVYLDGPEGLFWTSVENTSWLEISPKSGLVPRWTTVSAVANALSYGWQEAQITFITDITTVQVPVTGYLGTVKRAYMPLLMK